MKCNNKTRRNKDDVSKLMTDSNAKKELTEFNIIGLADKNKKVYLGKPSKCKVDKILSNIQSISQCSRRFKGEDIDNYSLLMMKYGGQNLEQFGDEVVTWVKTVRNRSRIELFWLECVRLFYGLKLFCDNDIVHHDLKHQNIVYDEHTNRINFIDFGFMTKKSKVISAAKNSRYDLGIKHHWSFPMENIYWNKFTYLLACDKISRNNVKQSGAANVDQMDMYKEYTSSLTQSCGYFFTSIFPIKTSITTHYKLINKIALASFENVIEFEKDDYDRFINKTIDTVDTYGLGFALLYVLNRSKHLLPMMFSAMLYDLFTIDMINPRVFLRQTPDQLLAKYEHILTTSGFLEKHKKHIENHLLVNKISPEMRIMNEIADEPIDISHMDFSNKNIELVKNCPEGKEFNSLTKRCIKVCKPGYDRNPAFKCVRNKTPPPTLKNKECPIGKELNPNTKRCVNICKPGQSRNATFKCVRDKSQSKTRKQRKLTV
jgi:serine/threonine protein kinase